MRGLVVSGALLGLMCAGLTATAQPLSYAVIPEHVEGKWAASASGCSKPALVVTPVEPYGFRFTFNAPVKRDEIMLDRPPPPKLVGAPDPVLVTFTPKTKPATTGGSQVDPDIDVQMPSPNEIVLKFWSDGKQARFVRCAAAGIG